MLINYNCMENTFEYIIKMSPLCAGLEKHEDE